MRNRVLGLSSLAILLAGGLPAAEPVSVYLDFEGRPSEVSVQAMEKEASALMIPAGLRLEWRTLAANTGKERSQRLVVVRFSGECATGAFLPPPKDENNVVTLGATEVAAGYVLPYSEVKCDAVRRFLPESKLWGSRREKDFALGKAMGRVLAHELYHALWHTTLHGRKGLTRAVNTPRDLRSEWFRLRPSEVASLKR